MLPPKLFPFPLSSQASDFSDLPDYLRLPPELHSCLLGSVMLAAAKRLSAEASGTALGDLLTYKEASELLSWAMDQAFGMRQEVLRRVR